MKGIETRTKTVYTARYTTKDGTRRCKTFLSKKGAASALAWWIIFDKRADDNGILDTPSKLTCMCDIQWSTGVAFFEKNMDCEVHGFDGYFDRLHNRFVCFILAKQVHS